MSATAIHDLLGTEMDQLLSYTARGFPKDRLHLPGPDFVDRVIAQSDRPPGVLRNFQAILNTGRLAHTGYVSILPVDQGIEHSAGAASHPTRSISTRRTSSAWRSKAAATPWRRRSACWGR